MEKLKKILVKIWHFPRFVLCVLITIYQKTLSLDHGPLKKYFPYGYCKFKPTCSSYCHDSIKQKGVLIGGGKCMWRIMRCNPCGKGGYDPDNKIKS
jgi:hypothetical protein